MSNEIITITIAATSLLIILSSIMLVGFTRMRRHMDQRFDQLHTHYEHLDIAMRKALLKFGSVRAQVEQAEDQIRALKAELQEIQDIGSFRQQRSTSAFFLHDTMLRRLRW